MQLLHKIIEKKHAYVAEQRIKVPVPELVRSSCFKQQCKPFASSIGGGSGIIGEFKRRSPSYGEFAEYRLEDCIEFYQKNMVSAVSVLTDEPYFGGSCSDLIKARKQTNLPILRKDFIIDEYQLFEAKAYGADAVLLIAAILEDYYTQHLTTIAKSIGLEVLMEFHTPQELEKLNDNVDVIGINNRNLDSLITDVNTSVEMAKYLPYSRTKISESGIKSIEDVGRLKEVGYDGFLIGESILKEPALLMELHKKSTLINY